MLSHNFYGINDPRGFMPKERIEVEGGKTYGPYSPGVKSNGMIWLAGQIAPEAGDDVQSQTKASLQKIDDLLNAAGVTKNNVCFVQVLLADIDDFGLMNEVYTEWLEGVEIPPARAAFEAGNLPRSAKIEIVVQATE
jgi:2-iminobutanoate/2-iminopropanoate deaminase